MQTPICKTYVDECTYSKKPTRKYKYYERAVRVRARVGVRVRTLALALILTLIRYEKAAAEDPLSLGGG